VNTNRRADPSGEDEQRMLDEGIVALYFEGYKEKIELLSGGDVVFLYSNERGVIAYGEVEGNTQKQDYKGMNKFKDEEYFLKLKNFTELVPPVSSADIQKIVGKRIVFAKAFFRMDKKLAALLISEFRLRNSETKAA